MYFVEITTSNGRVEYLTGRLKPSSYGWMSGAFCARTTRNLKIWRGLSGLRGLIGSLREVLGDGKRPINFKIYRIDATMGSIATAKFTELTQEELVKELEARQSKRIDNPESIYKIKYLGKFVEQCRWDMSKTRYGRIFYRGGAVRNYLRNRMMRSEGLSNHEVIEIIMSEDGNTPKSIITHSAADFYCKSPACRKKYTKLNARK